MLRNIVIGFFILVSLGIRSQITFDDLRNYYEANPSINPCSDTINFTVFGEIEWHTFVCGSAETDTQITDSLLVSPNPFNKRTLASYSFAQNDSVTLNIFNSVGQNILTIHSNSVMPSGNYQDSIIMDTFPDGIYFARLKLGSRKTLSNKIIKDALAGISELSLEKELNIYPNPVSSYLNIDTKNNDLYSEIFYSFGRSVLKTDLTRIDVSELSVGLYHIRVTSSKNIFYNSTFIKD